MASAFNNVRGELAFPEEKRASEQQARMDSSTSGLILCVTLSADDLISPEFITVVLFQQFIVLDEEL